MGQIKNSFDAVTKRKILNSFLLSLLSAGGGFIGALVETKDVKASAIITLCTGGAFIVQAIRKYIEGKE